MLDAQDVSTILDSYEEQVLNKMDTFHELLEKFDLMDEDGDVAEDVEEEFEACSSSDQKEIEKGIRTNFEVLRKGLDTVIDELATIDDQVVGDDDDEEDDDGD